MKIAFMTFVGVAGLAAISIGYAAESSQADAASSKPVLMAEAGKDICQPMTGPDGSASAFELCVANGLFAHDVYSVRIAGVPVVKGIDDETTKGVGGTFYGNPISLKCEPINEPYDKVTDKELDERANSLEKTMPNSTFEERKRFAILMNTVETGRHCALSNSNGIVSRLDVKFPG
ncbi:hypothetical protein [Paraburkholderia kururiensis]|uniref:hypothetical protein n=1 Tax=Paraburkholderia kururiensis TaxID=984307 RepID=UPI0018F2CB19|nr:hypothetical protein [Paraburkholderia kururiensis]